MDIKLTPISEPVNEEMNYAVELDETYTVKDFIDKLLSEHSEKFKRGYICIYKPFTNYRSQRPNCKYEHGKLISEPLPNEILIKNIERVTSNGGWGVMDFTLYLA